MIKIRVVYCIRSSPTCGSGLTVAMTKTRNEDYIKCTLLITLLLNFGLNNIYSIDQILLLNFGPKQKKKKCRLSMYPIYIIRD